MPQRIRLSRRKGWRKPEGAVVVARPTKWGNPYTPRNYRFVTDLQTFAARPATVAECIDLYRRELTCTENCPPSEHGWTEGLDVRELAGRDLACWCPLDQPCHADVLLDLANAAPQVCIGSADVTAHAKSVTFPIGAQ